jgi:hypothetical protein
MAGDPGRLSEAEQDEQLWAEEYDWPPDVCGLEVDRSGLKCGLRWRHDGPCRWADS